MKRKLLVPLAAVGICVAAVGAGCQGANSRDLEGVPFKDPDKVEVYINVDGNPNITRLCIDGVAFGTTSRDYGNVFREPGWDRWCGVSAPS